MLSPIAVASTPSPSTSQSRPGLQDVSEKTPKTAERRSTSPSGYARFVTTVLREPAVVCSTSSTRIAAPRPAAASDAVNPSSQSVPAIERARLRSSSTIPA